MGSVMSVFGALTHILASRWIHSKDWVGIGLPRMLYFNTALLLLSSVTFEMGRRRLARGTLQQSLRWLTVTLLLGLAFISGQILAWREVVARGLLLTTNPGTFFFYAFTAVHGLHLLGGVAALAFVILSANRLARRRREKTAVSVVAFYWHFMDVLWVYLLGLLIFTVQH
jgi:cytochrome c oxidase subunit 3